jgi:hypothetical protein
MGWLVIVLLVSLLALLIAAAGVALHIYQRAKFRRKPIANADPSLGPAEETDLEP